MASTDAEMSVVLDGRGAPRCPTGHLASALSVDAGTVTIRRDGDTASEEIQAPLPAVVSVTDQTDEARYPSFKSIMASKKKPVTTWTLSDLGIEPARVGLAAAACVVRSLIPKPPRQAGTVVIDEGDGAVRIADFLAARAFL
jgi:electron transfer flavoprotein beta subunit